ncbi:cytochrome P450 [Xylariaceae sp. AK1471]|nr:cytochrome P450 [Xylariaceae sp. AK1471]
MEFPLVTGFGIWPPLVAVGVIFAIYHAVRAVYLIYFSPLSIFPGSKWAAVSELWEAWYNIGGSPGKRGQTLFLLEKMHRDPKYGTAIRMGPNEIHVYDPAFYHTLYSLNTRYYKDPAMHKVLGAPTSTVAETDPVRHKHRRAPLESLFSRQSILKLESMMMEKVELACTRFDEMYQAGRTIRVEWAVKSLSMDMISEFALGRSMGALHDENFMSGAVQVFRAYLHNLHVIKAFPIVRSFSETIPLWLGRRLSKTIAMGTELDKFARARVEGFVTAFEGGSKPAFPTVMERLITPNAEKGWVPPDQDGLRDEILTLISAGNDTTGITAMTGLYQILRSPDIQSRLLAELKTVMPRPRDRVPYTTLERLPYLTAVIKESLRYASAAASRTPRLVPAGGVTLPDGRFLPAGTRVGMSIYQVHFNPDLFPEPRRFLPERWMDREGATKEEVETQKVMNHFFVPFSKGTRSCIGINLAYMELYLILAYFVRRYDFATDTTDEDMRWDDMVIAMFHGEFTVSARPRTA